MTLQEYKDAVLAAFKKENPNEDYSPLFDAKFDQYYQEGLNKGADPKEAGAAVALLYAFSGGKLKKEEKKVYTLEEYKAEVKKCLDAQNAEGKDYSKYFGADRDAYFQGCMRSESSPQKTADAIVSMAKWESMFG